jgi:peptide deformylase
VAQLTILHFPDRRLRNKAQPVQTVTDDIRRLIDDMAETMYTAPGIGLAAIQVDVPLRVLVIDLSETRDQLQVFINPEIIECDGEQTIEEGCLSVPGIYEPVTRPDHVKVRALDRDGKPFDLEARDLLATCIQHEIDHLNGIVFVDHLSRLKRARIKKKLDKQAHIAM